MHREWFLLLYYIATKPAIYLLLRAHRGTLHTFISFCEYAGHTNGSWETDDKLHSISHDLICIEEDSLWYWHTQAHKHEHKPTFDSGPMETGIVFHILFYINY